MRRNGETIMKFGTIKSKKRRNPNQDSKQRHFKLNETVHFEWKGKSNSWSSKINVAVLFMAFADFWAGKRQNQWGLMQL